MLLVKRTRKLTSTKTKEEDGNMTEAENEESSHQTVHLQLQDPLHSLDLLEAALLLVQLLRQLQPRYSNPDQIQFAITTCIYRNLLTLQYPSIPASYRNPYLHGLALRLPCLLRLGVPLCGHPRG